MKIITWSIRLSVIAALGTSATCAAAEIKATPAASAQTWDKVANIKDAATRIAKLQASKGAEAAYKFIDACYRTHSLAEQYSQAYESCIAQDYLQTKMLVQIYSRTPPETLKKYGSPSAEALSQSGGRRIVAAFAQYKIPVSQANEFKDLVDKHGVPVFVSIVFPGAIKQGDEKKPAKRPRIQD